MEHRNTQSFNVTDLKHNINSTPYNMTEMFDTEKNSETETS